VASWGPGVGSAGVAYTVVNTCYDYRVVNTTDAPIFYSPDSGTTWDMVNARSSSEWFYMASGLGGYLESNTDFYVAYEAAAPTVGGVNIILGYY
jgi:hypothetical protein